MTASLPTQQPPPDEQLRLSDYVRPLLDRLLLIVGTVILVGVAVYVYYDRQPKVYVATTSIFLSSTNLNPLTANGLGIGIDDRTTLSQATLLTTRGVAVRVAERLGFTGDPGVLRGAVVATPTAGSDFINISTRWGTGRGAADIANAFASEFIRTQSDQQRGDSQRLLARLQNQQRNIAPTTANVGDRANLSAQIRQLQLALQLPASGAKQVDAATDPGAPAEPRPKRDAIFAVLLALLAAVALAYALDRFDRRIRRAEDAADTYGLPLLSVVPHVSQFGPGGSAPAGFVEAFRLLQTNLRLAQVDRAVRVVVVTSAVPGEGKSTVVRYLAEAFSEWGKTVAVIDADLRRPSLTRLYGAYGKSGLTDLVSAEAGTRESSAALVEVERPRIGGSGADVGGTQVATPTARGDDGNGPEISVGSVAQMTRASEGTPPLPGSERAAIHVLPSGTAPPNPAALLAAGRTRQLVDEISTAYDVVIIDTPPVLAVSDAMALVPLADAVILVSRVGKTTRDEAERLVDTLRRIPDAQLTGIVANDDVNSDGDRYGHYYTT
ncbi:MAG: P-loop NTPase [Solirubrobacteraceae bacterium]